MLIKPKQNKSIENISIYIEDESGKNSLIYIIDNNRKQTYPINLVETESGLIIVCYYESEAIFEHIEKIHEIHTTIIKQNGVVPQRIVVIADYFNLKYKICIEKINNMLNDNIVEGINPYQFYLVKKRECKVSYDKDSRNIYFEIPSFPPFFKSEESVSWDKLSNEEQKIYLISVKKFMFSRYNNVGYYPSDEELIKDFKSQYYKRR